MQNCDECKASVKSSKIQIGGGDFENLCPSCWEKEGIIMVLDYLSQKGPGLPLEGKFCFHCDDRVETLVKLALNGNPHFGYCQKHVDLMIR
jgi:hypothetical protein